MSAKSEPVKGWESLPSGYVRCRLCGAHVVRAFVTYVNGRLKAWSPAPCDCTTGAKR